MNHRFLIVLSVAIFYNGVIYASPVNNSEGTLPPEKPTTPLPAKTEQAHDIVGDHPALNTQKQSVPLNQSEIPANIHPNATSVNATVAPQVIESKNVTHDTINKNSTSVIGQKNSTLIINGKNASLPITNNATSPNKNDTGLPSTVLPSTLAPQIITTTPAVVPEKPTTTTTTTTTAPTTLSTTTATKMNATTIASNSTSSDKAVMHDVATSVQEQHFHGPSFIGGIVLTVGLTAIGFIAFKYYKAGKIDMNYRTL